MALNLSKDFTFTPSTTISSSQVNTDLDELYSAFSGLEAGTNSLTRLIVDNDPVVALGVATKQYVDAVSTISTVVTKTSNYTATTSDDIILCSGSAFTVTLYTAVNNTGRQLTIKKTDSSLTNIITIDGNASETIEGATTYLLHTVNQIVTIISDGANWQIIDRSTITPLTSGVATTITGTTSNPTKGTTAVDTVRWFRDGVYAVIQLNYQQTGAGAAGSGNYLVLLPDSLTADTAVSGTNSGTGATISQGIGTLESDFKGNQGTTDPFDTATAVMHDSTHFKIVGRHSNVLAVWGSGDNSLNNATVTMVGWLRVPISGWNI